MRTGVMRDDRLADRTGVRDALVHKNGSVSLGLAEAGDGRQPRSWLSKLGGLIAEEHVCAPPSEVSLRVHSSLQKDDGSTYTCPECGQVFARFSFAHERHPRTSAQIIRFPQQRVIRAR